MRKTAICTLLMCIALLSACSPTQSMDTAPTTSEQSLEQAYEEQLNDIQVTGNGVVTRILSDDTDGDRHQRFILALDSGQTLLVAHNIDIAPRIDGLQTGDSIEFNGVYEWNDEGGVIHWTHHDPDGEHEPGWLIHDGSTYE